MQLLFKEHPSWESVTICLAEAESSRRRENVMSFEKEAGHRIEGVGDGKQKLTNTHMKEPLRLAPNPVRAIATKQKQLVLEDDMSTVTGLDPKRAMITKRLFDAFNAKIEHFGLHLMHARLGWNTANSTDDVFHRLERAGLFDQSPKPDSLPPENLPIID
jgi:hypothetical protein